MENASPASPAARRPSPWAGLNDAERQRRIELLRAAAKRQWADPEARKQAAERAAEHRRAVGPRPPSGVTAVVDYGYRPPKPSRLTAIKRVNSAGPHWCALWLCQCDCGCWAVVRADRLVNRRSSSCGCRAVEAAERNLKRAQGRLNYTAEQVFQRRRKAASVATVLGLQ